MQSQPMLIPGATAPDALVRTISRDIFSRIQRGALAAGGGDRAGIVALASEKLIPHLDATTMTRMAAGRYWRMAAPHQRALLVDEFRMLVVRAYADTLWRMKGAEIHHSQPPMLPPDANTAEAGTTFGLPDGGEVVRYRLHVAGGGLWMIYDIRLKREWVLESWMQVFAECIATQGIDGLVGKLREMNERYAAMRTMDETLA